MSIVQWAENEVKLACKKENSDWDGKFFDYGCSCYQSALKAYKSLCEDGHSGFSFNVTKNILIRLMNTLPLTAIEDTEDVWCRINVQPEYSEYSTYQCNRMCSLFKDVYKDGTVKYHDVDRAVAIDENGHGYSGSVCNIIDEMFPITMTYYPPVGKYKLYTKEFLAKGFINDDTDYNTRAVLYCIKPDGERVEINRYFADSGKGNKMVEITKEEYEERLKNDVE